MAFLPKCSGLFFERFSFLCVKWVDNPKVDSYCEYRLRPSERLVRSEDSEGQGQAVAVIVGLWCVTDSRGAD